MPRFGSFSGGVAQGLQFGLDLTERRRRREGQQRVQERQIALRTAKTAQDAINTSIKAIQEGVQDFVDKGVDPSEPVVQQFVRAHLRGALKTSVDAQRSGFGGDLVMSPQQVLAAGRAAAQRAIDPERRAEVKAAEAGAEEAAEQQARTAAGESNTRTLFFEKTDEFATFDLRDPEQRERFNFFISEAAEDTERGRGIEMQPPALQAQERRDLSPTLPTSLRDFTQVTSQAGIVLQGLDRIASQLPQEGKLGPQAFTGVVGQLTGAITGIRGAALQLKQFMRGMQAAQGIPEGERAADVPERSDDILNPDSYDIDFIRGSGAEVAARKSNVIWLAYAMARSADPGGRLSEKDVERQLDRLGAELNDPNAVRRTLAEVKWQMRTNVAAQHAALQEFFPEIGELPTRFIPSTPQDEQILERWRGRFDEIPDDQLQQLSRFGRQKLRRLIQEGF